MQQNGLGQVIQRLLSQYKSYALSSKPKSLFKLQTRPHQMTGKPLNTVNPLQTIFKRLSSTMSQIIQKPASEDYRAIVHGFLPNNAKLLSPQNLGNSGEMHFADLDGDTEKELIASYALNDEVRTIILKKQNERWSKVAEINNTGYDSVHYSGVADLMGNGRKQILLGLVSKGKASALHGYTFENNMINKMFDHNYHRFEVVATPANQNSISKTHLAVWNRKDPDTYNIDMYHWNGQQLEPLTNVALYYYKKVVPFYAQKVKRSPKLPSNWYNFADALVKADAKRDALQAIELGMRQDTNFTLKENFLELKNRILGK